MAGAVFVRRYAKINSIKIHNQWRKIMRLAKVEDLRKEIEILSQVRAANPAGRRAPSPLNAPCVPYPSRGLVCRATSRFLGLPELESWHG